MTLELTSDMQRTADVLTEHLQISQELNVFPEDHHAITVNGFVGHIYVSVKIAPEAVPPYARLQNIRAREGKGTGQGLGREVIRRLELAARQLNLHEIQIEKGTSYWKRHPDYIPTGVTPVTHRKVLLDT